MGGNHYQISEASKLLEVEAHVLRYWEEEIGIEIPRNEMGHREYTEKHLYMFRKVKEMKAQGYQLKAIREALKEDLQEVARPFEWKENSLQSMSNTKQSITTESETDIDVKLDQFQAMMTHIVAQAMLSNNEKLSKQIGYQVEEKILRGMGRMMSLQEEREEERYRKLDETLRAYQRGNKTRQEVAISKSPVVKLKKKKKHSMFKGRSL